MAFLKIKHAAYKIVTLSFLLIANLFIANGQEDLYNWKVGVSAGFQNIERGVSIGEVFTPSDYGIEMGKSISKSLVLSGGFIYNADISNRIYSSLLFHADNGWFLSERSGLSPILAIGLHYDGSDPVKLEIAGEAGLKLRISDRISSNITYLTYFPGSDIRKFEFSGSHNQTVKLSLNYHFSEKKSNYKSPVFYAGAFLDYPGDSISGSGYGTITDEEDLQPKIVTTKIDTLIITDTGSRVTITDTTLAEVPLAMPGDSLYIQNDTLSVEAAKILPSEMPDTLKGSIVGDTTESKLVQIKIPRDTIRTDSLRSYKEYPDSVIVSEIKDSIVDKPALVKYPESIIVNNNFNVIINDSTLSVQLDDKQALVIKLTPQYIFADKETAVSNPQTTIIPASKPENLKSTANTGQVSPVSQAQPKIQGPQPVSPQPLIGIQQQSPDTKARDSLLLEQNRLLIEILAKLSVPSPEAESQVLILPAEKVKPDTVYLPSESLSQSDTIIEKAISYSQADTLIRKDTTLTEPVIAQSQPELNIKIEILESRLKTLNNKLDELSGKLQELQTREEIKTVVPKDPIILKKEPEPDFTGKYPMNFYFVTNEFVVKPALMALLKTVVNDVNSFPEYKILISGFADRFGNPEYNTALSLKRAESLKTELISLGVDSERIVVTGLGSKESSPDSDPQLDRRVEIQLFKVER